MRSSPLWSNVSKVTSLWDRPLKVFLKCICHCLCLRICLFVGQVMFPHHSNRLSQVYSPDHTVISRKTEGCLFNLIQKYMKMTAVGESDPNLATKCLDFCQALSIQGVAFNFSLSVGSNFSFSLNTGGKAALSPGTKKKGSPSTCQAQERILGKETKSCSCQSQWGTSSWFPGAYMQPMWLQGSLWKGAEATH